MEGLFYDKFFQEVAYTMHNINPSFNFETSYSPILPYFELKHTKQCCTISKGPGIRAISPGPHSVVCNSFIQHISSILVRFTFNNIYCIVLKVNGVSWHEHRQKIDSFLDQIIPVFLLTPTSFIAS